MRAAPGPSAEQAARRLDEIFVRISCPGYLFGLQAFEGPQPLATLVGEVGLRFLFEEPGPEQVVEINGARGIHLPRRLVFRSDRHRSEW